jgi:DNA-binding CsgD family transcriptional regulator
MRAGGPRDAQAGSRAPHSQSPAGQDGWDSLTDAELKVVNLIAQGATNRAVAEQLHVSLHTVKNHVHNAFANSASTHEVSWHS